MSSTRNPQISASWETASNAHAIARRTVDQFGVDEADGCMTYDIAIDFAQMYDIVSHLGGRKPKAKARGEEGSR